MGYTHYYKVAPDQSITAETWAKLVEGARKIVDDVDVPICNALGDENTLPTISVQNGISLNGSEEYAHETFKLRKNSKGFNFCKTARKPYDVVVTCILLRAYNLAPNVYSISSDGYWEEWLPARELYSKLWPDETIKNPGIDEEPSEEEP